MCAPARRFAASFYPACGHHAHLFDQHDVAGQPFEFAFGDVGFAAGDMFANESQFAFQPRFFGLEEGHFPFPIGLALADVGGVVAAIAFKAGWPHFPDPIDDAVQKIAVVADDDERAFPAAQGLFQPFDGGHVQMIGRLVEDEQVWFFQEQTA